MKKVLSFTICVLLLVQISFVCIPLSVAALPSTLSQNKVYLIKNAATDMYLGQSGLDLTPCFASTNTLTYLPNQLFRLTESGGSGLIMPMTTCSSSLTSNLALSYYNNGQNNLGYFEYFTTASVSTFWTITKLNNGNYTIRSTYYGNNNNYLSIQSLSGNVVVSSYSGTYSEWIITEIINDMYFNSGYSYLSQPSNVCAKSTADVESLFTTNVLLGTQDWNGYSENVNVTYLNHTQPIPSGKNDLITISSDYNNQLPEDALGCACPVIAFSIQYNPSEISLNSNWQFVFIYLNYDEISSHNYSDTALRAIVAHETGHCLKLKHTVGGEIYNARYIPSIMQLSIDVFDGYTYVYAYYYYSAYHPTTYNIHSLINKWN